MAGYLAAILLHGGNFIAIARPPSKEAMEDIRIQMFTKFHYRYLTCWTFVLQLAYGVVGLLCDLLILKNSKTRDYKLPKYLKGFRDTFFASIIWPSTFYGFQPGKNTSQLLSDFTDSVNEHIDSK
ncbi:hypothetical protein evm_015046 [Chilo suppressalis]|nr:hypothetical protein evm_015046 [Chilo suppressalis]